MKIRRILPLLLVVCVIFTLTACSNNLEKSDISISELLRLSEEANVNNYRQVTIQNVNLKISGSMMSLDMTSSTAIHSDVYDENHVKTETVTKSSMTSDNTKTVSYIVDNDVYLSTYENKDTLPISIKTTKDEMDLQDVTISQLTDEAVFQDAKIMYNTKTKQYEVTVNMSKLLDRISLGELLGDDSITEDQDTYNRMLDEFKKTNMVYKYNESYQLVSVVVDNLSYAYEDPTFGSMSMTVNFDIQFMDYGKVTVEDVEVPQEVLDAVDLDNIVDSEDGWIAAEDGTITDELLEMYNKAVNDEKNPFVPKELLATNVSNGVSYLFLVEDEFGNAGLVGIYKNKDGELYLLDSSMIPSGFMPKE